MSNDQARRRVAPDLSGRRRRWLDAIVIAAAVCLVCGALVVIDAVIYVVKAVIAGLVAVL